MEPPLKLNLSKAGLRVFAQQKAYFEEIIDTSENKKLERRHSSYSVKKETPPPVRRSSHLSRGTGGSLEECARLAAQKELQANITRTKAALVDAKTALRRFSDIEQSPAKTAAREEYARAEREVEEACRAWCVGMRRTGISSVDNGSPRTPQETQGVAAFELPNG